MEQQNYWELGRWGRIPVAMHWTVLLILVWFYVFTWNLIASAIASAAFFVLLIAHEFGHVAMLRRRKIPVERITLYALHGRTHYAYGSPKDDILVAWSGVGAQLVLLLAALAVRAAFDLQGPIVSMIAGPILLVFIPINIVLMVVALLPIGPFDGRAAWAAIAYLRNAKRRRAKAKREIAMFPEKGLTPEKRRELEESSSKAAADLLEKLSKKTDGRKEDA
jgi:Zn-dependent protease